MFEWFKRKPKYRDASSGAVHCPRHGYDVEFDKCLGCGELVDVRRDEKGGLAIRCVGPGAGDDPQPH